MAVSAVAAQRVDGTSNPIVHAPGSPLVDLLRTCNRIAGSEATVLITGETGTGKEVVARLIHERSSRASRSLVPVSCGAIPEALLESELFGHVKGAFTGATTSRRGRIAAAEGGTLFLDEIGELPLSLQVKLLRVLQERSYEPVGATEAIPADFRLVAATNKDLAAEVAAGRFRRDLYYRLLVCPVEVPPLRARRADVGHLFAHFWAALGETRPVAPAVVRALEEHPWPGNVRELENLVERLSVISEGPVIRSSDLPLHLRALAGGDAADSGPLPEPALAPALPDAVAELRPSFLPAERLAPVELDAARPLDLPALLRRLEDSYIDAALAKTAGNRKAAADLLGLQRTTLVEKLRRRQREASIG